MGKAPDLSEFVKLSRPKRKPCAIIEASKRLSEEELEQLTAAFKQDKNVITNAAIRDWFSRRNETLTPAAIGVHRRGECSCVRDA